MTAKKTTVIAVPGVTQLPTGTPFLVYERGADIYEALRLNQEVDLKLDDGSTVKATVQHKQVGALIDLVAGSNGQSAIMVGRIGSPSSIVQALQDAASEAVLDVTKLYTAVSVSIPYSQPNLALQTA